MSYGKQELDYTTIDATKLSQFEQVKDTRPFMPNVERKLGVHCFLQAPGHPKYFCQSAPDTRKREDSEARVVLFHPETNYRVLTFQTDSNALLDRVSNDLFIPLDYGSDRVQAWIERVYGYYAHTYKDDKAPTERAFFVDSKHRAQPSTHAAYLFVHQRYAQHEPRLDMIEQPVREFGQGNDRFWWERRTHQKP